MARRQKAAPDPTRRLAEVDPATGATGKIGSDGTIYTRGMEAQLPKDFPQDGPHWEDYVPDDDADAEQAEPLASTPSKAKKTSRSKGR